MNELRMKRKTSAIKAVKRHQTPRMQLTMLMRDHRRHCTLGGGACDEVEMVFHEIFGELWAIVTALDDRDQTLSEAQP